MGRTYYTVTAKTLYPVASALMYHKIDFEYHAVVHKHKKREYSGGYIDFCLHDSDKYSFAELMYDLQNRYNIDDVTIMGERRVEDNYNSDDKASEGAQIPR